MIRHEITPRAGWQDKVAASGLVWHSALGQPYWNESAYYEFTRSQIEQIEEATADLYRLFLRAGDAMIGYKDSEWLSRIGIPEFAHAAIRKAWEDEPPCLNYGRMDFGFDGDGPPKLFEFNCDTPTSLLEASVIQWQWKEECFPDADQYNSIHETLISKFKSLRVPLNRESGAGKTRLHFAHVFDDAGEDTITTTYMMDCARAAGFDAKVVVVDDIGIDAQGRFVDYEDVIMDNVFKLYPWEWIVHETYGPQIINSKHTHWMEPIWKMIWSNKGILPLLWTLEPDNPFLLHAGFESPAGMRRYVEKPFLAREGANVKVVDQDRGGVLAMSAGDYGDEGVVYQELYDLPETAPGVFPIIGSWIIDGDPCGMGIREDGLITGNLARFVPHIIKG